jgi:Uncharacterized protein conserved in bacteria
MLTGIKSINAAAAEKENNGMMDLRAAVLNVDGETAENSYNNIISILKSYGIKANSITPKEIIDGKLSKFDVLVVPGGRATGQAKALGKEGCGAIEEYIKNGGGYIGVCAGAFLASEGYNDDTSNIVLVDAKAADVEHWDRGTGDVQVKITDKSHPILKGYYGTITVHYENGPVLQKAQDPNIADYSQLAAYVSDVHQNKDAVTGIMPNSSALTASEYGNGRCVLFSFHPELSAGLQRMLVQGVLWSAKVDAGNWNLKLKDTPDVKVKGAWLWGSTVYNLGADGAKIITDQMKSYGFTDIFLLVKGTGGSVGYNSKIALSVAHPDMDVLKEVVDEAHKKGIRVHAWFCVDSDSTWAAAHPEDIAVHVTKGRNSTNITPMSTAYRNYEESLIREVIENYDVDGIHLDYIRYSHIAYGFDDNYEIARANELGINMDRVRDLINKTYYTDKDGISIFNAYDNGDSDAVGWVNIRRNAVKNFASEIRDIVKSNGPDIKYSASLMPEGAYDSDFLTAQGDSKTFAEVHYGQDYNDAAELYDFVTPMLYWSDYGKSPQWSEALYENARAIFGKDRVYAGLQEYSPVKSSDLSDAVNFIREGNGDGIVAFRYGTFGLSSIDMKDIGHKQKVMNITMTDPLSTDNTANVNITKVEISMAGNLTAKSFTADIPGSDIKLSGDGKTVTITGNPCIPQNGTINISLVVEGENETGREPAQVRFYVTSKYSEVRVFNQY